MTPTKGLLFASLALLMVADSASAQRRGGRGGNQGNYQGFSQDYQQDGQTGSSYRSFYPPGTNLPATIELNVPADAQVWFNGQATTQTGTARRFVTPPLNPESDYSYELKVRYNKDGEPKEETRTISVVAGGLRQVNLNGDVAANPSTAYRSFYPPNGNQQATIELTVPADAQVWFDGQPTTQTGTVRRFVTPPLRANADYSYEVKIRYTKDGEPKEETRTISVVPGGLRQLNLVRSTRQMPAEAP